MTPERAREIYRKQKRFGKMAHKRTTKGVEVNRAKSQARFDRLVSLIREGKTKQEAAEAIGVSTRCIEDLCKRHFGSYHYPTPEELDDVV